MKVIPRLLLPLLVALVASCAEDSKPAADSNKPMSLSERVNEKVAFKQDSEGHWAPNVNRRSSFEKNRESPYFKSDYAKKEYKTGEYAKKSWWGNKEYKATEYAGNTDGSRFKQASKFSGQSARDAGKTYQTGTYETGAYGTGKARESGRSVARTSDAETDSRRRTYTQPPIIDWQAERKLSVKETNRFLGRD